ncbi:MAG: hypothetical protein IBX63_03415 [Coriobacteriia bacterium]|nr:hypothetical protein [Coriobacteriia bacterium]
MDKLEVSQPLALLMGAFALFAAVWLLVEVARLRRIAAGAAFAEHMSYVSGGVICLAASVLVGWIAGVLPYGLTPAAARFLSDALVGVSMVLLGIYFVRVRRAIARYLDVLNADAAIARAHIDESASEEQPGV